jgi:hypothetical protein
VRIGPVHERHRDSFVAGRTVAVDLNRALRLHESHAAQCRDDFPNRAVGVEKQLVGPDRAVLVERRREILVVVKGLNPFCDLIRGPLRP